MEQIERRTVLHNVSHVHILYPSRFRHLFLLHGVDVCYDDPPLLIVNAGLHWSLRISKQILPLELMLGW